VIDLDAAGFGWFVDATPYDNSEFEVTVDTGKLKSTGTSDAFGAMDLLTVVSHEIGHLLGFDHGDSSLMTESLATGVRLEPLAHDDGQDDVVIEPQKVQALQTSFARPQAVVSAQQLALDSEIVIPAALRQWIELLKMHPEGIATPDVPLVTPAQAAKLGYGGHQAIGGDEGILLFDAAGDGFVAYAGKADKAEGKPQQADEWQWLGEQPEQPLMARDDSVAGRLIEWLKRTRELALFGSDTRNPPRLDE
jgi:hypothetical protein